MSGACEIRVRGRVQGVGFRPTVWRHARALALDGEVLNDGEGVLVRVAGGSDRAAALIHALRCEPPPLAEIDSVETTEVEIRLPAGFHIVESQTGRTNTQVTPDALLCGDCRAEIADSSNRRFGYAFTNCTHCGPRLTIVRAIPYDRANTTMSEFPLCAECRAEYENPADRRFHAEPIACPVCGPKLTLRDTAIGIGQDDDAVSAAVRLLTAGAIVAIKGLGGYQLACDATNSESVARLRHGKRREGKPFALMIRDIAMVQRYCRVSPDEERLLTSAAAPIVLLERKSAGALPGAIAPGLNSLGIMLPTTPLHALLFAKLDIPLVMTSGNLTGEPQITADDKAMRELGTIAPHILLHDREIANRVDDSVVRFMAGRPRLIRRARGYAPAPIRLPDGFESAPALLAMGGELKATFCLLKDGFAVLSQHQGDLEQAPAFDDYRKNLALYAGLFEHVPQAIAIDQHPDYLSSKFGRAMGPPVIEVQHHHAHIASCMAENGWPRNGGKVIGLALDGLGYGNDGTIWGGEFLVADYCGFERLAWFKPVAMPGGTQAIREPWRNLYAQLESAFGNDVAPFGPLTGKPLGAIDAMIRSGTNAPLASSCGRLFDAVAAALGLCSGAQAYEGDAAGRLEALAEHGSGLGYPFAFDGCVLDSAPMWERLLRDLAGGTGTSAIASRFHTGLAEALAVIAKRLAETVEVTTVALSGGCFQNRLLFERTLQALEGCGLRVLTQTRVPANDGGLALGQAAIAAARLLEDGVPCA